MSQLPSHRPTPKNQFSFSRLKSFDQCPFKYRLRYLKGLKEAFRSIESYLGNTVHDVLEWMYEERRNGASPDETAIVERFDEGWREDWPEDLAIVRIDDGPDTYFRVGREMLKIFVSDVFDKDRSETLALEERYSTPLSDRIVFTGFADRVGRTTKGKLFVIDYKTSKRAGDSTEFSEGLQAPLYAACALEKYKEDSALAGYHYLRLGISNWHQVDQARARQLLERFKNLAEAALDTTEFPAKPGILCAWCGFNHICTFAEVPEAFSGGRKLAQENMGEFSTP
ncbi:MAG: PD-(D/E)XK nuclease family protein [Thermoanaerobaculales bacterium]|nr:PD-(D/E)XK nuclease family protein [Thermoanaerobaculales bacterium]